MLQNQRRFGGILAGEHEQLARGVLPLLELELLLVDEDDDHALGHRLGVRHRNLLDRVGHVSTRVTGASTANMNPEPKSLYA